MKKSAPKLRFQPTGGRQHSKLPVGKKQQLKIERLAHDGRGIAFLAGQTWFVASALPGELVEARVLASRGKTVEAIAVRVLQPSPQRQLEFCPHAGVCGGCTLQHMPVAEQRQLKQQALARQLELAGVAVGQWYPMLTGQEQGYRRRARLAVKQDKSAQIQLGFRALSSSQIVAIEQCPILLTELSALISPLRALLNQLQQPKAIGHLELFQGYEIALLVRLTQQLSKADKQLWLDFASSQKLQLWWQTTAEPFSEHKAKLGYYLTEQQLFIGYQPGDFVQVNAEVNQLMVTQALQWLELNRQQQVLELFCGLGNFSLAMAQQAAKVVAVEGVPAMVERAQHSAQAQGIDNLHFYHADLSEPLAEQIIGQAEFAGVLLDPPRDGAAAVMPWLGKLNAERILYVSCNPATLARDAALLVQQGYHLAKLCALDMFTHTGHVEAMALFVKVSK